MTKNSQEIVMMLTRDWPEKYTERLEEKEPDLRVIQAIEREEQQQALNRAEIVVGLAREFEIDLLVEAEGVEWIQTLTAGVDEIINSPGAEKLEERGVKITSMSGIHGDVMAEHTFGYLIGFSRRFHEYRDQQRENTWERLEMDRLSGRKLLIIGMGSIGREIARVGRVMNMKVAGIKRDVSEDVKEVDELYPSEKLEEAAAECDYAVSILPYTPETEGMLAGEFFSALPDDAYFVNVGRGEVVDEKALLQALDDKELAGAGLDVFAQEPLPEDSPFFERDNVIMTPHVAGIFPGYYDRALEIFQDNLERYRRGDELKNRVSYELGY
ncbi:D-2-hydroxyacid dehydrogenase [Halarsenatibacter silvermanii]|uniref:Phosphoglycerate dehydrogenase n=1 Tax=Halarsenatibacter silvermanii TaxID=321763 RepID=A0A1G9LYN4_9FIRM|nr:D-2-hydroxyacid dehydrogenase [Halarsenatibacter silvermanii]SDL66841.1 Phosphoglycerate dehydrogenase [Halarsenatibacter silvermanii]